MDAPHDATEIHKEKARLERLKNAMCCFEQILEAKLVKPAIVRPLTSNLTSHPSKLNKTCSALLENKDALIWTRTDGCASFGRHARTYIHQLCVNIGGSLEYLSGEMEDETKSGNSALTARQWLYIDENKMRATFGLTCTLYEWSLTMIFTNTSESKCI